MQILTDYYYWLICYNNTCTSAPSIEVFSAVGLTVNRQRTRLTPPWGRHQKPYFGTKSMPKFLIQSFFYSTRGTEQYRPASFTVRKNKMYTLKSYMV